MPKYDTHYTVKFAKNVLKFKKKFKEISDTDVSIIKHLTSSSISDFGKVKLLDGLILKYKEMFSNIGIDYVSIDERSEKISSEKKPFSEVLVTIDKNVVELRLPFLVRSKYIPLSSALYDFGFNYFPKENVWYQVTFDPNIFDDIENIEVLREIGIEYTNVDEKERLLTELKSEQEKREEIFELSSMTELEETEEFKGIFSKLYPYQKVAVEFSKRVPNIFIADSMGLGKAQSVDSMVFTPRGKKRLGDIQVGDEVIGSSGKSTVVTGVFPQGKKPLYRVTFTDNSSTLCCEDHLWKVSNSIENWTVISLKQMLDKDSVIEFTGNGHNKNKIYSKKTYYKKDNGNNVWRIPMVEPIEYDSDDELLIDPYLLGLLLGDGSFRNGVLFSNKDSFIIEEIKDRIPDNIYMSYTGGYDYRFIIEDKNLIKSISNTKNKFSNEMKRRIYELGLYNKFSYEKFIPDVYKYSSVNNRIELLRGLMDSDGTASDSMATYTTTSSQLANDIQELVHGLGGTAKLREKIPTYTYKGVKKIGRTSYTINVKLASETNPFKVPRKRDKYNSPSKYKVTRYIKDIKYEKDDYAVCISVDASDSLYVTDSCIVTHNTIQALAIMEYHQLYPVVIVVPASLRLNWKRELSNWIPNRKVTVIGSSKIITESDIYVVSYSMLKSVASRLRMKKPKLLIADESHYLKSEKSSRSITVREYFRKVPRKILMTGTPIKNRTSELINQLDILGVLKTHFGGKRRFKNRYCPGTWNGYTMVYGEDNVEELQQELRKCCMIRREKKDVLTELPDKTRQVIYLPLSDSKLYEEVESDSFIWLKNKLEETGNLTDFQINKIVRSKKQSIGEYAETAVKIEYLKQAAVKYKLKSVYKWIDNTLEQTDKLVVFAHHRNIIEEMYSYYKDISVMYYGGMGDIQKEKMLTKFQTNDKVKLAILSMAATGTGTDGLQTVCDKAVFVEFLWNYADHEQCEDRLHRIGQESDNINIYYLIGENTIEEWIYDLIMYKGKLFDKITKMESLLKKIYEKKIKKTS